jgi:hypothetical protein
MRESCTSGSVRGALSNERPYRDRAPHRRFRILRMSGAPCPRGQVRRALRVGKIARRGNALFTPVQAILPTLRRVTSGAPVGLAVAFFAV